MTSIEAMLCALRTQVCGAERTSLCECPEEVLASVYSLAKFHDVAHLVAAELEAQGALREGEEISAKFRKQQMLAVFRYERIAYELESLCRTLEKAEISFIPLKGSVLRAYYPEPWMRTSCDIDVLVSPDDLERAMAVLQSELGYTLGERGPHDVSLFAEGGVHVELHYSLLEDDRANHCRDLLERAWEYAAPISEGAYQHALSDDMFYFYHIAHMAKHFEGGGCGVRPFLDLWILMHAVSHEEEKRRSLLTLGGLDRFAACAEKLAEAWFGNGTYNETTAEMERYLLFGGVYGTVENRVALQQSQKGGRGRYLLARIWAPSDVLKQQYPCLQKHPWLLPAMQVRRWLHALFGGGIKRSVRELQATANTSSDRRQTASDLLEKLGL